MTSPNPSTGDLCTQDKRNSNRLHGRYPHSALLSKWVIELSTAESCNRSNAPPLFKWLVTIIKSITRAQLLNLVDLSLGDQLFNQHYLNRNLLDGGMLHFTNRLNRNSYSYSYSNSYLSFIAGSTDDWLPAFNHNQCGRGWPRSIRRQCSTIFVSGWWPGALVRSAYNA